MVFSLIVALNHDKIKIKITFIPQCLTNKHGSKICIITYTCPVTSFKFSIFTAIIDLKGVFWIWGFLVEKNKHQLKYQLKKESPEHQHSETLLHIQWKQGNNQQYGSQCKFSLCPPLFCCIVVELNWCHATWIVHVSLSFCPPPFLLCRGSTVVMWSGWFVTAVTTGLLEVIVVMVMSDLRGRLWTKVGHMLNFGVFIFIVHGALPGNGEVVSRYCILMRYSGLMRQLCTNKNKCQLFIFCFYNFNWLYCHQFKSNIKLLVYASFFWIPNQTSLTVKTQVFAKKGKTLPALQVPWTCM